MKILKTLLIMLVALLLTGCYTQLQYSQKMNKVTDRNKQEVQSGQKQADKDVSEDSAEKYAEYSGEEEHVPIYYKDYDYVDKYRDCKCSPYNVYNFYGSPYSWYDYHRPYFSYRSHMSLRHSYYFHDWHRHHYFGYPRFAVTFSWGSPYYYHHRFYHDPFYYHYGYSPFAYNYHRFYGSFGSGYYYGGQKVRDNRRDNVNYGPRSIGTNRVASSGKRVRENGNNSSVTRTRSVGTARSQDTVSRSSGTVSRTRSQGNTTRTNSESTRTRTRNNDIQRDNSRSVYIDRTDALPVVIDRERYNAIRARTAAASSRSLSNSSDNNTRDLRKVKSVKLDNNERKRSTFLERMRTAFKHSSSRIITNGSRSSGSTVRSRSTSSSNRSSVGRTKSSSSRSSVSRSKSSSSNSRSRGGSSSSSRSRSGGDSGSDRSRGGS